MNLDNAEMLVAIEDADPRRITAAMIKFSDAFYRRIGHSRGMFVRPPEDAIYKLIWARSSIDYADASSAGYSRYMRDMPPAPHTLVSIASRDINTNWSLHAGIFSTLSLWYKIYNLRSITEHRNSADIVVRITEAS